MRTGRLMPIVTPHAHAVTLGGVHCAGPAETSAAIEAALAASRSWGRRSPDERTTPFLRAADLLERSPWRERLVAATMLELSKTAVQAEGDVIAETADLIRAGVANFQAVGDVQPISTDGARNHLDYRPLEGFVFAVSPFNYASMNHLALGPALLGNVVVWKPAEATALVSHLMLSLLREAGLPDGVINLVHGDGAEIGASRPRSPRPRRGALHGLDGHVPPSLPQRGRERRPLPRLSAGGGGDRGQGIRARARLGRPRCPRGCGRRRGLRLPGPEMLGREPLYLPRSCGRGSASGWWRVRNA